VGNVLSQSFYARCSSEVARDLLGAELRHETTDGSAAGRIVETEAYLGAEPACHGFRGRTERNAALFGGPGRAYVYLSYGVHWLLNAVCGSSGDACGVLIRAIEPTHGLALMRHRRARCDTRQLASGPGKLTKALGVDGTQNAAGLCAGALTISAGLTEPGPITVSRRIGISKAIDLPLRFHVTGSRCVSRPAQG
jgi:DNA-3-methyladenine glycosylase